MTSTKKLHCVVCGRELDDGVLYMPHEDIEGVDAIDVRGVRFERMVRCRDCKYYFTDDPPSDVYPDRYWCDKLAYYVPSGFYCGFVKAVER